MRALRKTAAKALITMLCAAGTVTVGATAANASTPRHFSGHRWATPANGHYGATPANGHYGATPANGYYH